jgi:putrescine aminotransferase
LKNLEIIARERLVERVADDTGPYLARALARLSDHPLVGEARSLGLIGAVEIVARHGSNDRFCGKVGTAGPLVRDVCIRNGLMVRAIGDSIVMCPPLIITHAEIDQLVGTLERSLSDAQAELRTLTAAA